MFRAKLILFGMLLCVSAAVSAPALAEDGEPDPRFVQRVVEFMWTEGRHTWTDTFRVRSYPRTAVVDRPVRISVKIRRTRNGVGKKAPEPLKVVTTVRREDGGQWVYTSESPGPQASFEHTVTKPGRYVASVVTYYTEEETYTIALHFDAIAAPEPELEDDPIE